ncbi:MAG: Hydroxypyruvate isomerase [Frankiales bacterium]|nr:Hydroxypyruvate isomerase [Frankiales bacterium]
MPRYLANCSMLFTEVPLLERPAAAHAAGFDAIELWWPFAEPVPADRSVSDLVRAVADSGVQLVALNFFGGDLSGPDYGALSVPAWSTAFRDNVDVAVGIGEQLRVSAFNALYGVRVDGVSAAQQDDLAMSNLRYAAEAAATIGANILIEAVSGPKPNPLRSAADAVSVVAAARAAGSANVGFLCDLFHLAANGAAPDDVLGANLATIMHVQIADFPGRGEPGSGTLDLPRHLRQLDQFGYQGWVGLEYRPTRSTTDSLGWLDRSLRNSSTTRSEGDSV